MSHEGLGILEERFQGLELELVKNMFTKKKKTAKYAQEVTDFALTVFFYSPKAYSYIQTVFTLPAVGTLRKTLSTFRCLPGFQQERDQPRTVN